MERVVERVVGLDVHRDTVTACVRLPAEGGGRRQEVDTFATTTRQLLRLRDRLAEHGVTRVGTESTGIYWKPVFYLLEGDFECWLINAQHLHHVPGRKTTSETPNGSASWSSSGSCVPASCLRGRSVSCAI